MSTTILKERNHEKKKNTQRLQILKRTPVENRFESESNMRRLVLITKREILGGTTTQTCEKGRTMHTCIQSLTDLDICHYKIHA